MKYFKVVNDKTYAFVLFYLLKQIEFEDESYEEESRKYGTKIKKLMACTEEELDLKAEQDLLLKYQYLQVYTDEDMFGLFAPNQALYLYTNEDKDKDVVVNDISIVGNCIYISDKEICSTVKFTETMSTNNFFMNFKEFVQKNHTEVCDFVFDFKDGVFTLTYEGKLILELTHINVSIAYSYVLYTLQHLEPLWAFKKKENGERVMGFNENFKIEKIERI